MLLKVFLLKQSVGDTKQSYNYETVAFQVQPLSPTGRSCFVLELVEGVNLPSGFMLVSTSVSRTCDS